MLTFDLLEIFQFFFLFFLYHQNDFPNRVRGLHLPLTRLVHPSIHPSIHRPIQGLTKVGQPWAVFHSTFVTSPLEGYYNSPPL